MLDWFPIYTVPDSAKAIELSRHCAGCSLFHCGLEGGCAAGTNWRLVNELVREGNFPDAYYRLLETHPFPGLMETCNARCQANCSAGHNLPEPVAIQAIEASVSGWAREHSLVKARRIPPSNGKLVTIIGGGIAGLTAAHYLVVRGFAVRVVDRANEWFGLISTAVPVFKQDKTWTQLYAQILREEGVELVSGISAGTGQLPLSEILRSDAVIIATGAHQVNPLEGVPGADLNGVYSAFEFLYAQNREVLSRGAHKNPIHITDANYAVVIGARDTADDIVHTLGRLRPDLQIVQIIRKPKPDMDQPDPLWPLEESPLKKLVEHDDHVSEKLFGTQIARIEGEDFIQRVILEDTTTHKESGVLEGRGLVFYATGFIGPITTGLLSQFVAETQVGLSEQGRVLVDPNGFTGVEKIFAGGDCVIGMSDYVNAMASGRRAARGVLIALQGKSDIYIPWG